ncbi:hypothetical protein CYMTET_42070 [Cymbomonas tetramitiformis]|uniref:B box-type domain-containing protein n=1 Tax=Cymbomonas tetramitiformis TaxID=36881 RepID=A0AAE0C4W5_9CHLO|nr:hypothetical protein CYMTET_42070 [Cymbomonas tetramitiformis]
MRAICDVCDSAPARWFCAADEAALCDNCDAEIHNCNKLAMSHVRFALGEAPSAPRCEMCQAAPAFFYCSVEGTHLCLSCDTFIHPAGEYDDHERTIVVIQNVEINRQRTGRIRQPQEEGEQQAESSANSAVPSPPLPSQPESALPHRNRCGCKRKFSPSDSEMASASCTRISEDQEEKGHHDESKHIVHSGQKLSSPLKSQAVATTTVTCKLQRLSDVCELQQGTCH